MCLVLHSCKTANAVAENRANPIEESVIYGRLMIRSGIIKKLPAMMMVYNNNSVHFCHSLFVAAAASRRCCFVELWCNFQRLSNDTVQCGDG